MEEYYSRRAEEYEQIYRRDDPRRQAELQALAEAMRHVLSGRRVLEVACGTGYWTRVAAEVADHIVATDLSPEMLAIAAAKSLPHGRVEFRRADAYALQEVEGDYDAALANFWLSHVPGARITEFLRGLHGKLPPRSRVFMADNVYVPGVGGELVTPPGSEDTYKLRTLGDGSTHLVLKNYFGEGELREALQPYANSLKIQMGACFWWVSYELKGKEL